MQWQVAGTVLPNIIARMINPAWDESAAVRPRSGGLGWAILSFFILPCLVFPAFFGATAPVIMLVVAAVVAIPCFRTSSNPMFRADPRADGIVAAALGVAAILLVTLGGAGRLLPITSDWLIRDAVLHDLVVQPWPFSYRFNGQVWTLRAPLGMYLLPALVGKMLGLRWAWTALIVQNSLAVFTVFRVLFASRLAWGSMILLIVFCLFGGWDIVGKMLVTPLTTFGSVFDLVTRGDLEWWAGLLQYSSNLRRFMWVQNHAIAGWLVTALLLLRDRGQIGIAALVMGAALAVVWSPFALIGAVPFVIKAGLEALLRRQVTAWDVAACLFLALALVPLALYEIADAAVVPSGFVPLSIYSLRVHLLFVIVEVFPFVIINLAFGVERGGFSRSTYVIAIATLVLMPVYRLGSVNDFVMEASIPALTILAVTTGHTAFRVIKTRNPVGMVAVGITLLIGLITPVNQVLLMLGSPETGISQCDLIQAWDQHPTSFISKGHYFAHTADLPALIQPHHPYIHVTGPVA